KMTGARGGTLNSPRNKTTAAPRLSSHPVRMDAWAIRRDANAALRGFEVADLNHAAGQPVAQRAAPSRSITARHHGAVSVCAQCDRRHKMRWPHLLGLMPT